MSHWTYPNKSSFLFLLIVALLQVNVCMENFPGHFSDNFSCLVQSPPFTLPYFNDSDTFSSYITLSQFIELFFSRPRWNFSSVKTVKRLDRDKSDKSSPLILSQFCMGNKNHQHWCNYISSVCLLYRSSRFRNLVTLNEFWTRPFYKIYCSCFVEVWIYLSLEWDSNAYKDLWACVDSSNMIIFDQHQPKNWFAYVCRLSNRSFINNCFACENHRRNTNTIFSNFLQQVFICLREGIECCVCKIVWRNVGHVW